MRRPLHDRIWDAITAALLALAIAAIVFATLFPDESPQLKWRSTGPEWYHVAPVLDQGEPKVKPKWEPAYRVE